MANPFQKQFDAQRANFFADSTKSLEWRLDQLNRMERMLRDHGEEFQQAVHKDFSKPQFELLLETRVPLANIDFYRENLKDLMAPEQRPLPKHLADSGYKGVIYREPYGVTLVIGPFNAPVLLLLDPAIVALAAGNPVILKPANTTPATQALFRQYIPLYFEPENVTVVTGGVDEMTALLQLPFDFIFFTGSSKVGKVIMKAAAENLTPVLLELGGQNPAFVDETADLDSAARYLAWGHNAFGGQWCISPGYIYVHEKVAATFIEKIKAAIVDMYGTNPRQSPDLARMISEHHTERVASYILPEKTIIGGHHDVKARYIDPTILFPSTWEDPAMQQEIFGPVLPILTYSDMKAAINIVKTKPKSLAGYVFSKNQATIDYILNSLSFGGGCVNMTNLHCFMGSMPFGGVGYSGIGKYYGKDGFDAMSNLKSILISPPKHYLDVFPPYAGKDIKKQVDELF